MDQRTLALATRLRGRNSFVYVVQFKDPVSTCNLTLLFSLYPPPPLVI